eukprot:20972-Prymnesium_polylepis.1
MENAVVLEHSQTRVLMNFVSRSCASCNFEPILAPPERFSGWVWGGSHLEPGPRSLPTRLKTTNPRRRRTCSNSRQSLHLNPTYTNVFHIKPITGLVRDFSNI